ncbi:class GN sortase [Bowmanella denitrificans]|uniref:Class GN sortase n=1 Tax=Bowmanella denitrificans TaxID=366582 RepID=A0ABN0XWE0_9ALTE|nr:class GN sortase [Bowmanella denitrificans]
MDPLSNWRSLLFYSLLVSGLVLLATGGHMQAKAWLAQYLISDAWQQALAEPDSKVKPWFYADTHVVAQLDFPHQHQRLTVLSGASGRNLAFGPGHLLASGELGNSAEKGVLIAGHNDTHFAFLQHLKTGEQFRMQLQNGTWQHFQVKEMRVVHQADTGFLHHSGLYLTTCYPYDSLAANTPWRLLVTAEQISLGENS